MNRFDKYDITEEEYNIVLKRQNNRCKICLKTFSNGEIPNIDHCHKTKKTRGILCAPCNQGLGNFKDNVRSLKRAAAYIIKTSKPFYNVLYTLYNTDYQTSSKKKDKKKYFKYKKIKKEHKLPWQL